MEFRNQIFVYLLSVVLLVPSLAGNIGQNDKPNFDEMQCNDTESVILLQHFRNQSFEDFSMNITIVLTDSENNIYGPLKKEFSINNTIFYPLNETFSNDLQDTFKNFMITNFADYIRFIIHADNADNVANIFQKFAKIFKTVTDFQNSVGIALTSNKDIKKEQVVSKLSKIANQLNETHLVQLIDRYSSPKGPPIAIFNNQSLSNQNVSIFLQDINYVSMNDSFDNFKFPIQEKDQKMVNCTTSYVHKKVMSDVNSYFENVLQPKIYSIIEQIQYSTSDEWKQTLIRILIFNINAVSSWFKELSNLQNRYIFLNTLHNIFLGANTFNEEFEDTFFFVDNSDAIHFLYTISDYAFASAQDKWPKIILDSKMPNPDSLEQWYIKKEETYFETKCVAISKGFKHQVRGTIVPLNEINIHQCGPNTTLLEIFAVEKVLLNVDLELKGTEMQVVIIAPVWKVINWIKIDLSGADAKQLSESKAKNGSETGNKHGEDGIAGLPGGSAGNFIGVANRIINGDQLSIWAFGGAGGDGQDGGAGAQGEEGEILRDWNQFDCAAVTAPGYWVERKVTEIYFKVIGFTQKDFSVLHGKEGKDGGRGGKGGAQGIGGYGGNVILFDLSNTDKNSSVNIYSYDGNPGNNGFEGFEGLPGPQLKVNITSSWHQFVTGRSCDIEYTPYPETYNVTRYASNATDENSLNLRKVPKTVPIFQSFPHTVNEYKLYVRPQLAKVNNSKNHLLSFYNLLNTRNEITGLYDTLSLVEEFAGLEQQSFDLEDQHHLIPSYTALHKRMIKYYINPNYEKEKATVYKDVIKEIYHLITEKDTIRTKTGYSVMSNISGGFGYNGLEQINKLEKQEEVNSNLDNLNEMIKPLDKLILQAESFINNNLQNAMRELQNTLDQTINSLLEEISQLKKNSRENEKKLIESREQLKRVILFKKLFGILKVGCALAGLVNPVAGMVGTVVSSGLSIAEPFFTQANITTKVAEVPKAVKALSTATEDYLKPKEKQTVRETQISKIMKNATPSGKDMINRMLKNIEDKFKKPDSEPVLLSYKSLDRNEVYINEEAAMDKKIEEAKKNKDADTEKDCKIGKRVLKYMNVGGEVLQTVSDTTASVMEDESKIDEIDKAIKESKENLKKLNIMEKKVYNEAMPLLTKVISFTDQISNNVSKLNQNELIMANWDVSNTIEKVQKRIKESFHGFNTTQEMNSVLDKLVSTYKVMGKMQEQVIKCGEKKSEVNFVAMMHMSKEREILVVDHHLMNAFAKLKTALIYNEVNELYKEWVFAFKQFSFPNGGDILNLRAWPDLMIQKDAKHVVAEIKMNVETFKKLLNRESKKDNLLENRAPRLFRGSCSFDETSFFVWRNESVGSQIENILSGRVTTIVAKTPMSGINALKFKKVGILFTAKNSSLHEKLFKIMKNVRIKLTHHGDSIYRFNNKTFEIRTNSTELTFNYPSSVDEVMRLPSSIYDKILNGEYMLSPYATWTIKLTSDNPNVFETLNEFKGQVDLELIGEGQVFESDQCDKACEANMMKYYKVADEIYN